VTSHTSHLWKGTIDSQFILPTRRLCQKEEHLGTLRLILHNFVH